MTRNDCTTVGLYIILIYRNNIISVAYSAIIIIYYYIFTELGQSERLANIAWSVTARLLEYITIDICVI